MYATLIIVSDKGFPDTVTKQVVVNDKPQLILAFTDTLICSIDKLPLIVQSTGTYNRTPDYNINGANTVNPVVSPDNTKVYTVAVTDKACIDSANATVNVLDFITVSLPTGTAFCAGDSIRLNPTSYALSYSWAESGSGNTLISNSTKNVLAAPQQITTYYVAANLGHCQASAQEKVLVKPYPQVSVSADTSICCYGTAAQLNGGTLAAYYTWSLTGFLQNNHSLSTATILLQPQLCTYSQGYLLLSQAGMRHNNCIRDSTCDCEYRLHTNIVGMQPLQLSVSSSAGTAAFIWQPSAYFFNEVVYNPVADFSKSGVNMYTYYVTATTSEGCRGSDSITFMFTNHCQASLFPLPLRPIGMN